MRAKVRRFAGDVIATFGFMLALPGAYLVGLGLAIRDGDWSEP